MQLGTSLWTVSLNHRTASGGQTLPSAFSTSRIHFIAYRARNIYFHSLNRLMQCYKVNIVQKHSLHAKRDILLVKHKGKNSLLDSWCNWNLHTRGKQWAGMETNMQENVYLRWYGDELFEVDWRDLSELTNLQRSRKSQIQKQDVQHLTAMKVNDLYRDVTHSCKQWKY